MSDYTINQLAALACLIGMLNAYHYMLAAKKVWPQFAWGLLAGACAWGVVVRLS